ncbi:hypothetical protein QJS10_CPB15g00871 [Acorus calamus]|uniref:Reverse transcriptase zinc-binding domain-containing protein n=1 Tax=Acorus calamus TaxID=4465 RepID=A0AAV9D8P5_ACOCL|nr:hypothetical protein QJS10_CPB15g00871 [Acorus calamus]
MTHVAKGIFGLNSRFVESIAWHLGDGQGINFWNDVWVGKVSLRDAFPIAFQGASRKVGAVSDREFSVSRAYDWWAGDVPAENVWEEFVGRLRAWGRGLMGAAVVSFRGGSIHNE